MKCLAVRSHPEIVSSLSSTDQTPQANPCKRSPWPGVALLIGTVLLWAGGSANAAEILARVVYRSKDVVPLVKLDPIPLSCKRGPFRLEIPVDRLATVEVIKGSRLKLGFSGGGTCTGKVPGQPLSGEWSHGVFKESWSRLRRLEILKPAVPKPDQVERFEAVVKGTQGAVLEGVKLGGDSPLTVTKGAFRFQIPWNRIQSLKRNPSEAALEVLSSDGKSLAGRPPEILRGEWQGAAFSIPGDLVDEVSLLVPPKEEPAEPAESKQAEAAQKVWGTILDDVGEKVELMSSPEFDGPFNLWDPIKQARDRSFLPLARDGVTYLFPAGAIATFDRTPVTASPTGADKDLSQVTLRSGQTYEGFAEKRNLLGTAEEGKFEIPLHRVKQLTPASHPQAKAVPKGSQATVRLASGKSLEVQAPTFFYRRKLLPDWRESGVSWTGGHTKGFLFVRLGKTIQRVSFRKLSQLEVPPKLKGKFRFVSRDGSRLSLQVDWNRHKGFENLMGNEQIHERAEAYVLTHMGLMGWLEPGAMVHIPWSAIRRVDLQNSEAKRPPGPSLSRPFPQGR